MNPRSRSNAAPSRRSRSFRRRRELHLVGQIFIGQRVDALTLRALTNSVSRFTGSNARPTRTR